MFGTDNYLNRYFEAQANLDAAEEEVQKWKRNETNETESESAEAAVAWRARVRQWRANFKHDLDEDGVPAPNNPDRRWLLHLQHKSTYIEDVTSAGDGLPFCLSACLHVDQHKNLTPHHFCDLYFVVLMVLKHNKLARYDSPDLYFVSSDGIEA